jgi:hypothetical protein
VWQFDLHEASFARDCMLMKFGIAIAARIPMITTTIINSMSETFVTHCNLYLAVALDDVFHPDRFSILRGIGKWCAK